VVVGAVCAALGLGAGIAVSRTASPTPSGDALRAGAVAAPAAPSQTIVVGPATARLGEDDKAALRALIREELGAERAAAAARADAAPSTSADPAQQWQLSPEGLQAFDRARSRVDDGLARGAWTEDDRAELRASLAGLPTEARAELVRPLINAVNEGKVHFAGHGPLF
jgi:hypothetical protein